MKGDSDLAPRPQEAGSEGAEPSPSASPKLTPELEGFLRDFTAAQRAPGTRMKYEEYVRDFLFATDLRTMEELRTVEPALVVDYRNRLQERGLSPSTINGRLVAVRGFFGRLFKTRQIPGNPADTDFVPGLQVSDVSRTEGLTVDEVNTILATCDGTLLGLRDR